MTIEFSLRRRATQARCFAILWLSLAIFILIGTYASLPLLAEKTIYVVRQLDSTIQKGISDVPSETKQARSFSQVNIFVVAILFLGIVTVSFACYLLSRTAFIEIELATRLNGLADALCIAGSDFAQLEKAAAILVPKTKFLSFRDNLSAKDLKPLVELLKQLH